MAENTGVRIGPIGEDDPLEIHRAKPEINGVALSAPPADEQIGDPIEYMITDEKMPAAMRVLAGRLRQAEQNMPAVIEATQRLIQIGANVDYLGKVVQSLSQQRALGELQMERQTRSAALDLAIKAAQRQGEPGDAVVITALAEAFLGWMKAGDA